MTHTVVGLFDDKSAARAAMQELVKEGFIQEDIDLSNRRYAGDADMGAAEGQGLGDRISNFFNNLFSDDEATARTYTQAASDADAILTVQVDSEQRARKAQEILDRHDAFDVNERGGSNAAGRAGTRAEMENESRTIPVVEEKMNVSKREVERGGARIQSRIVERPIEEHIRLREEHVVINRHPTDREVTDADMRNFQPGEMEITERAEVPVVGKEARVVEEVEIGKEVTERDETVRDTVRGTDVDIEEFGRGDRSRTAKP